MECLRRYLLVNFESACICINPLNWNLLLSSLTSFSKGDFVLLNYKDHFALTCFLVATYNVSRSEGSTIDKDGWQQPHRLVTMDRNHWNGRRPVFLNILFSGMSHIYYSRYVKHCALELVQRGVKVEGRGHWEGVRVSPFRSRIRQTHPKGHEVGEWRSLRSGHQRSEPHGILTTLKIT